MEIKIEKDIKADIENCISFLKIKEKNKQFLIKKFLPNNFQYILRKDFSEKEKEKIINEYTKHIYKSRKKEVEEGIERAKKEWRKVEKQYFQLANNIFKGHSWPKGSYRGVASIWHMFPRYIDKKMFFFPYNHQIPRYSNKVIAHEMLHFIFFDYLEKNYNLKEDSIIKNKPKDHIWRVSEVFNNVIEN